MTAVVKERTPPEVGTLAPLEGATGPAAILDLLRVAIERGIPVEALERLQALHERVSDRAAAAEFAQAVAQFQAACPPITKKTTAKIATKSGTGFSYSYAELDHIARTIAPQLQAAGLSYSWNSEMDGKMVKCTCILRHLNGHQVTAMFACPVENASAMTEQQKHAAALSYARRQSLIQVLGLTTCDPDTDAADPTPITEQQALDLEALCDEVGANKLKFLRWAGVESFEEIPARNFESAVASLRSYGAEKAKSGRAS